MDRWDELYWAIIIVGGVGILLMVGLYFWLAIDWGGLGS